MTDDREPAVRCHLDEVLESREMTLTELARRVGITIANLSVLKNDRAKAVRFSTLAAICHELECQPGDLFTYGPDVVPAPGERSLHGGTADPAT